MDSIQPIVLVILDGFGLTLPYRGNAITQAKTPNFDRFVSSYHAVTLQASGEVVGLPWGEMGNSEVGHLSLGSGQIVYQTLPRIMRAISDGSFFTNEAFLQAIDHAQKHQSTLHLMGLVSTGGVHSAMEHLFGLLELCSTRSFSRVVVHAFLDGRDTPHHSAMKFILELEQKMKTIGVGKIASVCGRFYAMDRDERWDRIARAYAAIAHGVSDQQFASAAQAIEESYGRGVYDEEVVPTVITQDGTPVATVGANDAMIFFNFRADRARQLTKAFVLPSFEKFDRGKHPDHVFFVTMRDYEDHLPVSAIAFPPQNIDHPLARLFSDEGYRQLHIAETEKYPHVTFFFNGGQEEAFPGEDRIMVPSPHVASYSEKPEMSARGITDRVIGAIPESKYKFIVINFANADMVGHTGDLAATIQAVEVLDECIGRIVKATLGYDGIVIVTADHGNAEEMMKVRTGEIDKEHSTNPVPCLFVGLRWERTDHESPTNLADLAQKTPSGILADVAPTILEIAGMEKPDEMVGRSLIS
jgi:2,3-bisphosphoglycerate-independent phosphoglycerate mutase